MLPPDYIDAIVAWRGFTWYDLLGSLNEPHIPLPPRQRTGAACRMLRAHECPDKDCTCGYYATKDLIDAACEVQSSLMGDRTYYGLRRQGMRAIGQVYLWGKIIEFERGYRAQFCYPKTILAADARQTERLCALYGCEEERLCTWESLFASSELNLYEIRWKFYNPTTGLPEPQTPTMLGPLPLGLARKPGDLIELPKDQSTNPPKKWLAQNRSHPKPLRELIARKEEVAKSDFWKRI